MKKFIKYSLAIVMTLILGMFSVNAAFPNSFTTGPDGVGSISRGWADGQSHYYAWPHNDACASNPDDSSCTYGTSGRKLSYLIDTNDNPVFCLDYTKVYARSATYTKDSEETNKGYACAILDVWKNNGYTPNATGGTYSKISATLPNSITATTNLTENQYTAIQMAMWDYFVDGAPTSCESYRTKTTSAGTQHVMTITEPGNGKLKLNDAETFYVSSPISVNLVGYTNYANDVRFKVKLTGAPANSYISTTPAGTALTLTDGYYLYTGTETTPKIYLNVPVIEESYNISNITVSAYAQFKENKVTTATATVARYVHTGNQDAGLIELSTTDSYTYADENKPLTFRISPEKITISKKDIANENEIEGAHIVISKETSEGTTVVDEYDSTTDPYELYLEAGTYTLKETLAPNGYQPVETVFRFEVSSTGKITLLSTQSNMFDVNDRDITVYNKLYDVPPTGSSAPTIYLILGSLLLVAGCAVIYIVLKKRKAETI